MPITVEGELRGCRVAVTWEAPGRLTGDVSAIAAIESAVDVERDVVIAGVIGGRASLTDPAIARATVLTVLDDAEITADDEPELEQPPEGAIP